MDIYRFINSNDVATHLREIGFEFTTAQAAYLVAHCDTATLEERMGAWREILNTMPNDTCIHENTCKMPLAPQVPREPRRKVHALIREDMERQEELLASFMGNTSGPFFPYASRWPEKPSWVSEDWVAEHGLWNTLAMPVPFSTFDRCAQYLEQENEILVDGWLPEEVEASIDKGSAPRRAIGRYDRHIICKSKLDEGYYNSYQHIRNPEPANEPIRYAELDGDYKVLRMIDLWRPSNFVQVTPGIPVPFVRGNIVVDPTARVPRPFVFCFSLPWKRDESTAGSVFDWEEFRQTTQNDLVGLDDDELAFELTNITVWPGWSSYAFGYEVDHSGKIHFDPCGASENYLNLEYYRGPLSGNLRALRDMSDYLKGELPLWELVNCPRASPHKPQ